jgi:hypothetical protein
MNCDDTQQRLDDFLDGALDRATRLRVQRHLDTCADCRSRESAGRALREALRDLPVVPPSDGFEERVLRRAADANRPSVSRRRGRLTALAMAASLVAGIGIGLQLSRQDVERGTASLVTIALQQREVVQLVFHSDTTVRDVTFSVALPEGVELDGYPGRREIVWQGALETGANLLSLPLVAHRPAAGTLRAGIRQGDYSRTFTVDVSVKPPDHTQGSVRLNMS